MKFRRRKAARPQEIVDAAADVFAEKGFAASKLEDIGKRAGISKGTLYLYYPTKEALFEAVVKSYASSTLSDMQDLIANAEGSIVDFLPRLFAAALEKIGTSRIPAVAKMVISEAGNFPELARLWQSQVIAPMLAAFRERIRREQSSGQIAAGPPELYAICMMSPMVISLLLREAFGGTLMPPELLAQLPGIHSRVLSQGLSGAAPKRPGKKAAQPSRIRKVSPNKGAV
ncbi:TetR/AcrR family transcriptional regulator [Terriglobus sp. RCC_193]|uniref:TetR/AcrR family transcriptional regulator n=1 Tax=Terriglobus sp. RCC_193 TaxID=3239218 RepID=UPI0035262C3E